LIEKPMALNEREAKDVEFAAASAGVTCMVGYSIRFWMARFVSELLAEGAVGEIHSVTGAFATPPLNRDWFVRPEAGGGALLYVGCHLIDLVLWLTGAEPTQVFATVQRRSDNGTDEVSAIQLGFGERGLAQFLVGQAMSGLLFEMRLYGRSGEVALRGRNFLQFELEVQSNVVPAYNAPTIIRPNVPRDHIWMMLVPEVEEFARAINENRPPAITASDGRRVLRVLDAVFESGRTGLPVALNAPVLAAY
jgi:predicted dehydrogenase